MEMGKLTSKGQVTVPTAVRKKLNLKPGDKIVFIETGNGFRIVNEKAVERGDIY